MKTITLKHLWLDYFLEFGCNTVILSKRTPTYGRPIFSDWRETDKLKYLLEKHDLSFWDFRQIETEAN